MLKYLINVLLVKMLKLIKFKFKFHTQQFFLYFRLTYGYFTHNIIKIDWHVLHFSMLKKPQVS